MCLSLLDATSARGTLFANGPPVPGWLLASRPNRAGLWPGATAGSLGPSAEATDGHRVA